MLAAVLAEARADLENERLLTEGLEAAWRKKLDARAVELRQQHAAAVEAVGQPVSIHLQLLVPPPTPPPPQMFDASAMV